jgi:hypothetical protein
MFGLDRFDAIINPPQVAILAVGAARDAVLVRNGQPAVGKVIALTAVVRSPRGRRRSRRRVPQDSARADRICTGALSHGHGGFPGAG